MWGIHNHKRRWMMGVGLSLALITLAPVVVSAQTGTPIQYEETVSGEVTGDVPCLYYWFEGAAGDTITADMTRTSGSLDGVLWLYLHDDFTADPVAFNDDRTGGGLDPLLTATLPTTDWYTLAACRLQHENMRVTIGTFDLILTGSEAAPGDAAEEASGGAAVPTAGASITDGIFPSEAGAQPGATPTPASSGSITDGVFPSGEQPTPTPASSGESITELIEPGTLISGKLESNAGPVVYQLDVHVGEIVIIDWLRTSGNLAPMIRARDADGNFIAQAATQETTSTLQLVFVAPADGIVQIELSRYGGMLDDTAGEFEFVVQVVEPDTP